MVDFNNLSQFRHNSEIFELLADYFLETLDYISENHEQIVEDNPEEVWRKQKWELTSEEKDLILYNTYFQLSRMDVGMFSIFKNMTRDFTHVAKGREVKERLDHI